MFEFKVYIKNIILVLKLYIINNAVFLNITPKFLNYRE